jgi:hypothetical protein
VLLRSRCHQRLGSCRRAQSAFLGSKASTGLWPRFLGHPLGQAILLTGVISRLRSKSPPLGEETAQACNIAWFRQLDNSGCFRRDCEPVRRRLTARMRNGRESLRLGLRFSWFFVRCLNDVFGENKSLLEAAINLAQFPEDQEKENRDYEQQELDIHFSSLNPTSLTAVVRRCAC